MALACMFSRSSERNSLIKRAAVAYLSRLSDNDPRAVVDEQTAADSGAGMYFDPCEKSCSLAEQTRRKFVSARVKRMSDAVGRDGMKSRIEKNDFSLAFCSRIALHYGLYVLLKLFCESPRTCIQFFCFCLNIRYGFRTCIFSAVFII